MSTLTKDLLEHTYPGEKHNLTIRDLMESGVTEAAEDDSYYYVIASMPFTDSTFWIVDKKTGKVIRYAEYVVWVVYIFDQYKMMTPPYEFVIG